jgi:hypothetical protein
MVVTMKGAHAARANRCGDRRSATFCARGTPLSALHAAVVACAGRAIARVQLWRRMSLFVARRAK